MPRSPVTREIVDDYGTPHTYTVIPHPAEEGMELLPVVLRIVGEAGGRLADGLSGVFSAAAASEVNPDQAIDVDQLESAEVDATKLGQALVALADEMVRAGGAEFCKKVLRHATRTDDQGNEQKVAPAFTAIYQGNYGELAKALWFALEVNFGPSLRARFTAAGLSDQIGSLVKRVG